MWPTTSSHARGYGAQWRRLRELVLSRDAWLCQPCLRAGRICLGAEVDHILSKSNGGTDDMGNLQSICKPCHEAKTLEEQGKAPRVAIGRDGEPVGGWGCTR